MLTTDSQMELFINDYKRSRVIAEASVRAVLNRAIGFEQKFQKPFYEFTVDEVLEMYKSAHSMSDRYLQNSNATLKHAARWMMYKSQFGGQSAYEDITKEMMIGCVDTEKQKRAVISYDDLIDIQNELLNWTDKGILAMLFLGAGGSWLKELTFFSKNQISANDGLIYLKSGKVLPATSEECELIRRACNEDELISFGQTGRIVKVIPHGLFKQRTNALSASDNPNNDGDLERRFRFIQRRLMLISDDLGMQLSSGSVQTSGLLHYLKEGVEASGLSFREYVKTDEAKALAKRYDLYSSFAPQMLIDKFEQYF